MDNSPSSSAIADQLVRWHGSVKANLFEILRLGAKIGVSQK
jgi:hypothetical protein